MLIEQVARVLGREDEAAAAIEQDALARDGVTLRLGAGLRRGERKGDEKLLHVGVGEVEEEIVVDEILVGAGRAPNVEDLGLEEVGVEFDRRGVRVDDRLRTTNRRVHAAGDVCMEWKFTHAAEAAAEIVVQNALFLGRRKVSSLVMPWCTYTDPEVAHVGLSEREAGERGLAIDTCEVSIAKANRAVTDGQEEGFAKVHVRRGSDRILGATIFAVHAGEMIGELTVAMTRGIGLGALSHVIHPYPTQAAAIKAVAGLDTRTRLTPRVKRLFAAWLRITGWPAPDRSPRCARSRSRRPWPSRSPPPEPPPWTRNSTPASSRATPWRSRTSPPPASTTVRSGSPRSGSGSPRACARRTRIGSRRAKRRSPSGSTPTTSWRSTWSGATTRSTASVRSGGC
jgi:hypothetical protein